MIILVAYLNTGDFGTSSYFKTGKISAGIKSNDTDILLGTFEVLPFFSAKRN